MEKATICRAITLYNNFLPVNEYTHTWDYCAFGVVDGIDVGDNMVLAGEKIPNCIWDKQQELSEQLCGKYVAQQVYVLKHDFLDKEENFWTLDEEYPFVFFLRVQCGENKETLWEKIGELEEILCVKDEIEASVYLTYDNADLFVVLRSKLYEQGAGMIDSLYFNNNLSLDAEKPCTLKNSFTVFALSHQWINNLQKNQLPEDLFIEEVFIKIIERENGSISAIMDELDARKKLFMNADGISIQRNTILGVDDDLISIKNIAWYDFLSLYNKKKGLLCNWIPLFNENIASATTIIKTDIKNYSYYLQTNGLTESVSKGKSVEKKLGSIYTKQIEKLSDKLKNIEQESNEFEGLKELKLIMNVLPKFAGEIFNDYVFFPIISPLNALLDLIECQNNRKMDNRPFFEFLKSFSMYVQGSVRSDKHSMQALDFNTKIYDIPCKLNAFYYAFIYNVKKVLGVSETDEQETHQYEFLVVPGLTQVEDVQELYAQVSETLRLMRVEIPERNFYNIHDMMLVLSHELAHYVGSKYRNRKERYEWLISSYAHIYVQFIKKELEIDHFDIDKTHVNMLEERTKSLIMSALKREMDEEYVRNTRLCNIEAEQVDIILEKNKIYQGHFLTFLRLMDLTMADIVQYGLGNIYSPILYELEKEKQQEIQKTIKSASERFIYKSPLETSLLTSHSTMEALKMLYEECFADLMAILLLNINIRDYINIIMNSTKQQGMTTAELVDSEIMYRVAVVLLCVVRCGVNGYDADNLLKDFSNEDTDAIFVVKQAVACWSAIMNEDNNQEAELEDYGKRVFHVYQDEKVLVNVYHYLVSCYDIYKQDTQIEMDRKETLKNIFATFSDDSIKSVEDQICIMVSFIEKYREEVLHELDEKNKKT